MKLGGSPLLSPPLLHSDRDIKHAQCNGTEGANASHKEVGADLNVKAVFLLVLILLPILDGGIEKDPPVSVQLTES